MGKFFDLDSPLMTALSRMADLIGLNLLVLLFFAPLFFEVKKGNMVLNNA